MSKKIVRGTAAEELRFITPTGEIISSPEGHFHMTIIEEKKLSPLTGFDGFIDVIKRGYAVIAAIKEEILITHSNELCAAQQKTVSNLELLFPNYKISLVKEEM